MQDYRCSEPEFIRRATSVLPRLLWFLGAGASRTAGMPTATDIIWDLKHRYYCLHENQDPQAHNINNQAVRARLQSFMESKGFPPAGSTEEYAFYFSVTFSDDLAEQQRYIAEQLHPDKISLNIGHRALAALLASGLSRVVLGIIRLTYHNTPCRATSAPAESSESAGDGAPDEITEAMLEAGCKEFWSFDPRFEDSNEVVSRIWRKMTEARNLEVVEAGKR
jgi:hypothetical protein